MLNIVILAAGLGKRMQSARPKVLHTLAGRPMLSHVLASAQSLSPDAVVVVVGHGAQEVRDFYAADSSLQYAEQIPQQGTGHAVQQAAPLLKDDGADGVTLVLYGDVPLVQPATLRALLDAARGDGEPGVGVLTVRMADATGYGRIVRDNHGAIARIVEHKDATPAELTIDEVNTGLLAVPTAKLRGWLGALRNDNAQGEYYLTDIIAMAVAEGVPVRAAQPAHDWETLGVNSRQQQAQLERIFQQAQADRLLEAGVTIADPARFDQRGRLRCGKDVFIDVGCIFEGDVTLDDGVYVGPHSVVRNAHIAAGARIEAYSHIDESRVGQDSRVGPYARLRPGSVLGARTHIGNFVEVKNSNLADDAKANHLTYIGDATIGARVNVGAGVITCNYDGALKHRTVIEDDAFIGSDCQLIAPVRIGRGATLGAGTTLTKDAPAEQLTVSRGGKQVSFPGWKRPQKP
jgi:bifunctional UDP-N-acetylglucosamine pyrophosphorylase/glucosamine-1-phosphate N-acetyltransferase